jgi:4-alpha-glucanotransferase
MERSSGVLLHVSSLPGEGGIGCMGKEAHLFVDFLAHYKQKVWQILPLGPVGYGNSPYQCYSAFAGNPLFIDLEQLVVDRLIPKTLIVSPGFKDKSVEFERVEDWKTEILREAFSGFRRNFDRFSEEYHAFMQHHSNCTMKSIFIGFCSLFFSGNGIS